MFPTQSIRFASILSLCLSAFSSVQADEMGKPILTNTKCDTAYTSIKKICDIASALSGFGTCTITADKCYTGAQEIFTGNKIELASPSNIKMWNGMGGFGDTYTQTTLCLLRDLADQPAQKLTNTASASLGIGDISSKQEIGFLSYNKTTRVFEGYHRLKACLPIVGCLDAYTQKFSLTPVSKDFKNSGLKMGQYDIYNGYALNMFAEGQQQGLQIDVDAIKVNTPYGSVSATPQFTIGRATGFLLAPYNNGNIKSLQNNALGAIRMTDIYGSYLGTQLAAQVMPVSPKVPTAGAIVKKASEGWISQIGLGSRNADPKVALWSPSAGVEFPARPDADLNSARSPSEKTPNAAISASVKVAYSPIDILPGALKALCNNFPVSVCVKQFDIYAKPGIAGFFTGQFNVIHNESTAWDGTILTNLGSTSLPDTTPLHMDQLRKTTINSATSVAAVFGVEAGVDLNLHLHITIPIIDDIDKTLLDVHPKTTLISASKSQTKLGPVLEASTQASQFLSTKAPFQTYNTFKGKIDGVAHMKMCLAQPSAQGAMPAEPTYSPGNPQDLMEGVLYPCNICIGYNDVVWTDENGVQQQHKGQAFVHDPASQASKPAQYQWTCTKTKGGCFDMCKFDSNTKKLTVVKTALEMAASGESPQLATMRCGAK